MSQPTTTLAHDYPTWGRYGFRPTTPRVAKRTRPDGLVDVAYRETNGLYSFWVAEASSIWLVVQELGTVDAPLDLDDLRTMLRCYPQEPIHLAQQYAYPTSIKQPYARATSTCPALLAGGPDGDTAERPQHDSTPPAASLAA